MGFYDFVTELEQIENGRQRQLLLEATTQANIAFLPAHVGVVRKHLKGLAKEKDKWDIKVSEGEDSNELHIEDRLKITVPKEHWECFQGIFTSKLDNDSFLNLNTILTEAVEDDMKGLRRRLKPALFEMYNEQQFMSLDKIINIWKAEFGVYPFRSREGKGPVVSHGRKSKDIQKLYGKLLKAYGEDKGGLEMLLEDIDSGRPLNSYDVFKDYDFLYGARISSRFEGVPLIFEAMIDMIRSISQSIYVGDAEVLDKIEEESRQVKRVGNVLYPVGGRFSPSFLRILKETIEDITTEEEEK